MVTCGNRYCCKINCIYYKYTESGGLKNAYLKIKTKSYDRGNKAILGNNSCMSVIKDMANGDSKITLNQQENTNQYSTESLAAVIPNGKEAKGRTGSSTEVNSAPLEITLTVGSESSSEPPSRPQSFAPVGGLPALDELSVGELSEVESSAGIASDDDDDSADEVPIQQNPNPNRDVTIAILGKSGAGKTTLIYNLLGKESEVEMSPDPSTDTFRSYTNEAGNITVIDCPGLKSSNRMSDLKQLSWHLRDKADLILLCISVSPGAKFDAGNLDIISCIQSAYGKEIWKHCIVVFTYSNVAWRRQRKSKTNEDKEEKYKAHIQSYAGKFKNALKKINTEGIKEKIMNALRRIEVENITVKTIFEYNNLELARDDLATLLAVPAGFGDDHRDDMVMPGFQETNEDWKRILFDLMVLKCREEGQETLLKFKYGAKATLLTASVGGLGGALAVGAGVGAGIGGLAGGPLGLAIGAGTGVIGAGIGALAFGTAGAAMGHSGPRLVDEVLKKDYQKRVEEDEND